MIEPGWFQVPSNREARSLWDRLVAAADIDPAAVQLQRRYIPPKLENVAYCVEGDVYRIVLDTRMDRQGFVDCVQHELAHARLRIDGDPEWHLHGDSFWITVGRIYRRFHRTD